jgi:hypothetical protein
MIRIAAVWARAAAGAAVLAAAALFGAPTAAHAADPLPDLMLSFQSDPVAAIDNSGATIGVYVYNYGAAPATGVTVTFDLSKLSDSVVASVPDGNEECKLAGTAVTCTIGRLEAGQVNTEYPLTLASKQGATPGDAGSVSVGIDGAEDDQNPADDTVDFPVTVVASGPDLVALAADLNTASNRVGGGDEKPLYSAVANEGDTAATDFTFTVDLPTGATFVERYTGCTYTDYYPNDLGKPGFVYGPSAVTCVAPLTLEPGEALLLFDETTGDSVFNFRFGKNLSGPDEHHGSFGVAPADEVLAAKDVKGVKGTGPSFADAVRKRQAAAEKAGPAALDRALAELDDSDNYASFAFFTKKNTLDVAVKAPAVSGSVGDTVDLKYEVVNNGPSDGGGPSVVITAPSGTVLLPAEWCYTGGTEGETRPESKVLRCNFESEYPTVFSGYGRIKATVQLKIKSTPGTDGTIVVKSDGVGSTESKPANNRARIVVDSGSDGTAGGLVITGAPTGLVAGVGAAALALGVTIVVLFRRRRVVLQLPRG